MVSGPERAFVDDDAPPESGVRLRAPAPSVTRPTVVSEPPILTEVWREVFTDVLDHVTTLAPLQGGWLVLDAGKLGGALVTALGWRRGRRRQLRERWPELVPGFAAMDLLVGQMVDLLC